MIYYGLATPPSFDPFRRLRTSSANVRLNFHLLWAQGSCWYLVLANQLQVLSPGPVYLPHHHDASSRPRVLGEAGVLFLQVPHPVF